MCLISNFMRSDLTVIGLIIDQSCMYNIFLVSVGFCQV